MIESIIETGRNPGPNAQRRIEAFAGPSKGRGLSLGSVPGEERTSDGEAPTTTVDHIIGGMFERTISADQLAAVAAKLAVRFGREINWDGNHNRNEPKGRGTSSLQVTAAPSEEGPNGGGSIGIGLLIERRTELYRHRPGQEKDSNTRKQIDELRAGNAVRGNGTHHSGD